MQFVRYAISQSTLLGAKTIMTSHKIHFRFSEKTVNVVNSEHNTVPVSESNRKDCVELTDHSYWTNDQDQDVEGLKSFFSHQAQ